MVNKFDTQFLIEGSNLDEDDIRAGIMASAEGDCLIVVGDEEGAGIRRQPGRFAQDHCRKHGAPGKRAGWVKYIRIFMFGERYAVSYKSAKPFAGI